MFAVGPDLLAIRPSATDLLEASDVLSQSPNELRFIFSEGQRIDPATLDGIRITRSGADESFEFAEVVSDLGTGGQAVFRFRASTAGETGNLISLVFTQRDYGGAGGPTITVSGPQIRVELNRNVDHLTTATELLSALNNNAEASALVSTSLLTSAGGAPVLEPGRVIENVDVTGANFPRVRSSFGNSAALQVEFLAVNPGPQAPLSVNIARANLGANGPQVSVTGGQVNVTLNTNPARLTTANELIAAVNANAQAASRLRAILRAGTGNEDVTSNSSGITSLPLTGGTDVVVTPGFVGVDPDRPNEVIVRFATRLVDDRYSIDIFGNGPMTLENVNGDDFRDGRDYRLEFELDRGAQVVAVVPQPIVRGANGQLTQLKNVVEVYFNDDDLSPASAQNPNFYRLIKSQDSVSNLDDTVFVPTQVQYDADRDLATLTFGSDLGQLPGGIGTYRLRIGTDEATPPAPLVRQGTAAQTTTIATTSGNVPLTLRAIEDFSSTLEVALSASDFGIAGLPRVALVGNRVTIELNTHAGSESTVRQVQQAIAANYQVSLRVGASTLAANLDTPIAVAIAADPRTVRLTGIGSSFSTATNVGTLGAENVIYTEQIGPQFSPLAYPGSSSDPGHRDLSFEPHLQLFEDAADKLQGISTITYNFRDVYGRSPNGNILHNAITENQKQRAREVFDLWSAASGVQFVEIDESRIPGVIAAGGTTITMVTGDLRAIAPLAPTGPNDGVILATGRILDPALNVRIPTVILDNAEPWQDAFAGDWFEEAMRGVGLVLSLGDGNELPSTTVMEQVGQTGERVYPGDHDVVHAQHVFRPEANDVDMYRFHVTSRGRFTAEVVAERLQNPSLLDATLTLYRENSDGSRELISRNDDFFSEDAFVDVDLTAGTYFVAVASTGNNVFDPTVENSGSGGTTQGKYELRLNFRGDATRGIVDTTGTLLDGDADGLAGGVHNFWFRAQTAADTIIVDKSAAAGGTGTLAAPFRTISQAFAAAQPGDIVRIVGNGGTDGNLDTLGDNQAYEFGLDALGQPLADGAAMNVPRGVTVMVDAGTVFKSRLAGILVGSTSPSVDRSRAALQILGTPEHLVTFTSYNDETIGIDTNPLRTIPRAGDWGGIEFRNETDRDEGRFDAEAEGAFLNYVNHADIRYGGGSVLADSQERVITPIQMVEARPTLSFNTIQFSADAAMSADPNSFEETNFHAPDSLGVNYQATRFTADYSRVGPDIHDNFLVGNSINGLFISVQGSLDGMLETMTVSGSWDDVDIVHVVGENLVVHGAAGGTYLAAGAATATARRDARLAILPGVVVKLDGTRIEADFGSQIIAEGTVDERVIFTSTLDDRFGAGGTFDTTPRSTGTARGGSWGGVFAGPTSSLSVDHAWFSYGGGITGIEGAFAGFNTIEIHQAEARVVNSRFDTNAEGVGGTVDSTVSDRAGRGPNADAVIFVRGAQPVILHNEFVNSVLRTDDGGGVGNTIISINANALNHNYVRDLGRATGINARDTALPDNQGPLVRGNRFDQAVGAGNILLAMRVRGEVLTTESVWDDTDITHVLFDRIVVPDFHTFGGLRLESSVTESLVVKLGGPNAEFIATGTSLENDDRIGGRIQILGQPGSPVVLTSLADDSVGSGFDLDGASITDTSRNGTDVTPAPGDWGGIRLLPNSHDRNVEIITESELSTISAPGTNGAPVSAQSLGELARSEKAGDENRRLGFEVQGFLTAGDRDVYSFRGTAGTEVWFDLDRTAGWLDTVLELVDSAGNVLASSQSTYQERLNPALLTAPAIPLRKSSMGLEDSYSTNAKDAGMRLVLPGAAGTNNLYHVRVRMAADGELVGGMDRRVGGNYQLNVRLRDTDEVSGSTIRLADIRYATNAIQISGQPGHSPLLGEIAETTAANDDRLSAQRIGNILASDRGAVNLTGSLSAIGDIDWFQFDVKHQDISGYPHEVAPVVFDVDYADQLARPNMSLYLYDANGNLIFYSQDANNNDDLSAPATASGIRDLTRGSQGTGDPFLGPISLRNGTYYLAMTSSANIPGILNDTGAQGTGALTISTEPIDSVNRIADDHLNGGAYYTAEAPSIPLLFDNNAVAPFNLSDVPLYVSAPQGTNTNIWIVDPFTGAEITANENSLLGTVSGALHDITMRTDLDDQNATFQGYTTDNPAAATDGSTGTYLTFDVNDTNVTGDNGEDGLTTSYMDNMMPMPMIQQADVGFNVEGITITGTRRAGDRGIAVGDRGVLRPGQLMNALPPNGSVYDKNIVYAFDTTSGAFTGLGTPNRGDDEVVTNPASTAGTQIVELGVINTMVEGANTQITGIAVLGTTGYAVSNKGGLYRINNLTTAGQGLGIATFVGKVGPVNLAFTGLSAGPAGIEGGAFAQMLFGIDATGMLHAFNDRGQLQAVFYDGGTSLNTGIAGANGITFGRPEAPFANLWSTTGNRGSDNGHGITQPPDFTRQDAAGGTSYHFGRNNPASVRNYDIMGGTRGTLMTSTFSLVGYEAADLPSFSFNYFLESEDAAYDANNPHLMYDSFRVFISDASGNWELLGTNNQFIRDGSSPFDEYDYNPGTVELADNTAEWKHAKIDLARFAGLDNLRLRFDFSSSGTMSVGNIPGTAAVPPVLRSGGDELIAVDAVDIADGDLFHVFRNGLSDQPPVVFEFDQGYTLAMPEASRITDGQSVTVTMGASTKTFEFDFDGVVSAVNVAVPISRLNSAEAVALAFATAMQNTTGTAVPHVHQNLVNMQATGSILVKTLEAPTVSIVSTPGVTPGNIAVPYHLGLPAYDPVAGSDMVHAIRTPLASQFTNNLANVIKIYRDIIYVRGHAVDADNLGPLGLSRVGGGNGLPGDDFGNFNSADPDPGLNPGPNPDPPHRLYNNRFEGAYIDDLVIGFDARGVMISSFDPTIPVGGEAFVRSLPSLEPTYSDITTGVYQVEIRPASDFSLASGSAVTSANPADLLVRSWDINERLTDGFSLDVPHGWQIIDGQTLQLGGVTLEFENLDIANGVQSGRTAIPFRPNRPGPDIAVDLVNIINSLAGQNRLAVTADKNINGARIDLHGDDSVIQRNTRLKQESNDTLATAIQSQIPLGTTGTFRGTGAIGDNYVDFPFFTPDNSSGLRRALDVDMVRFDLLANQRLEIDVDAFENDYLAAFGGGIMPFVRVFDATGTQLAFSFNNAAPDEAASRSGGDAYLSFLAPAEGAYYVAVSAGGNFFYDPNLTMSGTNAGQTGTYELIVNVGGGTASAVEIRDRADKNRFRDQGQLIIHSNKIQDSLGYGIEAIAGPRDTDSNAPHLGTPQILREINAQRLARGVVIYNNIVVGGTQGAIHFAGSDATEPFGAVPFGRIYNNTLYGASGDRATDPTGPDDNGILVESNASPTILNNIIANFTNAISVDATSTSTVRGGNVYAYNTFNPFQLPGGLGSFDIDLDNPSQVNKALFVNVAARNFYLAAGSTAIDSSVDALQDRPAMITVLDPLGYLPSPILAPARDITGQLRVDDPAVQSPFGSGQNVFKDRGAVDRSDFTGPVAALEQPLDNDAAGLDLDPTETNVRLIGGPLSRFTLSLTDVSATGAAQGSGINDASVTPGTFTVSRNGTTLVRGTDYRFDYDATNNLVLLTPLAGVWSPGAYVITVNNTAIVDIANNRLRANQADSSTRFTVNLGAGFDFGDAPDPPYPTALAQDGPRHQIEAGFFLGATVSGEANGLSSSSATLDNDDGVVFPSIMRQGSVIQLNVTASLAGKLDAWIDYNQDGDWDDAGEQILVAANLAAGTNLINTTVPATAALGNTYARFRLSHDGGLAPTGLADNGEVEDFRIFITDPGIDYGDAPDSFPTLVADNGAAHAIVPGFFLGSGVTPDSNGSPTNNADGDTDDGVTFDALPVVNGGSALTVVASAAGVLNAWFDLNQDGDWDDAGEQVFTDTPLVAGSNALVLQIPAGSKFGDTFARFRFSSATGLTPAGAAADGEVEDYRIAISPEVTPDTFDYGDAPNTFPTLLADDGARHILVAGVFLGSGVEADADGQPSPAADADVNDDGVVVNGALLVGRSTTLTVTASIGGFLDAWIDFNLDGDWNDPGEQIFSQTSLVQGENTLAVSVPGDASPGNAIARFRFSTVGGLAPTGFATSGEVEDYALRVINTAATWHNFDNPVDVNNQDGASPLDALLVINELNDNMFSNPDTGLLVSPATPPPYLDVNNDGFVSPLDALLVINALPSNGANRSAAGIVVVADDTALDSGVTTGARTAVTVEDSSMVQDHRPTDLALRAYLPAAGVRNDIFMSLGKHRGKDREALVVDDLFAGW